MTTLVVDDRTEDSHPHLPIELGPTGEGVGPWVPGQKHRYLAKWLDATRFHWSKWQRRILIDPFCGPGRIRVRGEQHSRDGGSLIAYRQSVASGAPFSRVMVGDLDGDRARACQTRLVHLGATVDAFTGPAHETVPYMVDVAARLNGLCLAYVDPYSVAPLHFSIFEQLARLKVDLAVHFSVMDVARNVDAEMDPERARFDDVGPGWRADPAFKRLSKSSLGNAFFAHWLKLVTDLGFGTSHSMPLICNSTGGPMYRLVFFTRHESPKRIWTEVSRNETRDLFERED